MATLINKTALLVNYRGCRRNWLDYVAVHRLAR
jgi:hypothetical protein